MRRESTREKHIPEHESTVQSVHDMTHLKKALQQDKRNPRAKISGLSSYILDHLMALFPGAFCASNQKQTRPTTMIK